MPDVRDEDVKRLMAYWLRAGLTGCLFATKFASEESGHIRPLVLTAAVRATHLGEQLEPVLLDAMQHHEAALLIFADIRREEDVARILNSLGKHQSWVLKQVQWQEHQRDDLLLGPGGQENPYRQKARKRVSLADMPHSLDVTTHDDWWRRTEENKHNYLSGLAEGSAKPSVTFCLTSAVRPDLSVLDDHHESF